MSWCASILIPCLHACNYFWTKSWMWWMCLQKCKLWFCSFSFMFPPYGIKSVWTHIQHYRTFWLTWKMWVWILTMLKFNCRHFLRDIMSEIFWTSLNQWAVLELNNFYWPWPTFEVTHTHTHTHTCIVYICTVAGYIIHALCIYALLQAT